MADRDLLIIGAGISGLSMAHYAASAGWDARVLEQEPRAGGCLHSHRFAGALDGFWLEMGAHSGFNSYGNLLEIMEQVGLLDRVKRRAGVGFRMFVDGRVRSIPSQLYYPALPLAPFRLLGLIKTGRNVAEYYGHIVGRRNYAAVFEPAFNAVVCQRADEFPADSLFQPRPRRKGVPRSFTLPGGLQTIADTLSAQPGIRIEFGQVARTLRRSGEHFVVGTDDREYTARAVSLATPVAVTASLLNPEFPDLAGRLLEIDTATVESVGVALPADLLKLPPVAGLIGRDEAFYSVVSRDTVPDPGYRGFTFHFRPGVLDEEEKLNRIAQVLGAPRVALGSENTAIRINKLPMLRVGHGERARDLDKALTGSRLALTGNYFTGLAIEECVTRSRCEFARLCRET